jgi:membrane fusion protein, multidrug efflux system
MHLYQRLVPCLLALLAVAACSKSPQQAAGGLTAQMPPPEVTVMEVQPGTVPVNYEYVGQTLGSREVEIRARVTGNVEKRLYEEGTQVQAGQALFQLDARPLALVVATARAAVATAEADIIRASVSAAQARRERDRMQTLADANAIGRKEADDAESAAQVASAELWAVKARLEQAKAQLREAQLNMEYASISAPISGVAGRALRQEGALVNANGDNLLTTLVQLDPLYVSFSVADADWQRLNQENADGSLVIPAGGFSVRLLQQDGTVLGGTGRINFTSSTVSSQTGTLEMRATLANPANAIKSGQFVRVILEGAQRPNALVVPQRAVLEGPKGKMVLVAVQNKQGQMSAESRPIEVGEWVAGTGEEKLWVVRRGLLPGDQVIVEDLMKLRPGMPIRLGHAAPQKAASAAGPVSALAS